MDNIRTEALSPAGGGRGWKYVKANKENYYAYNPKLQRFANNLRKDMTKGITHTWPEIVGRIGSGKPC